MLFNSIPFLIFLPIVFILYWLFKRSRVAQNVVILLASYVFYGWWDWRFLALLLAVTVTNFVVGLALDGTTDPGKRKGLVWIAVVVCIGLLGFFKYFNFFINSAVVLLMSLGVEPSIHALRIILPVGISFYVFQALGYTIDVYRGDTPARRDPLPFFAFVSFFPVILAGPIERAANLLAQFERDRKFDIAQAKDGIRQMLWGFFKKIVIADNLAPIVKKAFDGYASADAVTLIIGAFFFAIQIYCDFSGYSDIAIGVGKLFGFRLTQNFNYPYFSRDITDFWRRWNISLSSWLRDYIYVPLAGGFNRKKKPTKFHRIINIIITFLASGLWHGAGWTYVFWGFLHGAAHVPLIAPKKPIWELERNVNDRMIPSVRQFLQMLAMFVFLVLAWVFFRAISFGQALGYIAGMFNCGNFYGGTIGNGKYILLSFGLLIFEWFQHKKSYALDISGLPVWVRWIIYYGLLIVMLEFGAVAEQQQFIYFQF